MKKILSFVFALSFVWGITLVYAEELSSTTVIQPEIDITTKPGNETIFKTKEVSFVYKMSGITEKTECVYSVDYKEKNKLENCKEGKIIFELENGTHLLYFWVSPNTGKEIKFEVATPTPVDGFWSDWSPVKNDCGITYTQERTCTPPTDGGKECSEIDGGNNTKIVTNDACPSSNNKKRSGSSGSYIAKITPAITPSAGQVLGAEKFIFTLVLKYGLKGNEVTELQKVLIAGGYLKITTPTGYFGPLTRQAVKEFQLANKLDGDGIVGPLTREVLNK